MVIINLSTVKFFKGLGQRYVNTEEGGGKEREREFLTKTVNKEIGSR